ALEAGDGHRLVGLVLEVEDAAAGVLVTDDAHEQELRAGAGVLDRGQHARGVDRAVGDLEHQPPPTGGMSATSAPGAIGVSGRANAWATARRERATIGASGSRAASA